MKGIYQPIAAHLQTFCRGEQFVIYRDAFRWKKYEPENEYGDPVMPNHFECMSIEQIAQDIRNGSILDDGRFTYILKNGTAVMNFDSRDVIGSYRLK